MICAENVNIAAHLPVLTVLRSFEVEKPQKTAIRSHFIEGGNSDGPVSSKPGRG
jgi:hypothetical protein